MTEDKVKDVIAHSGVLGMKWGVRKRYPTSSDRKEVNSLLEKKKAAKLSTAELKKVNDRLQAEQTFKTLNPGSFAKGMNAVKAGTAAAGTLAGAYAITQTPGFKAAVAKVSSIASKSKVVSGTSKHEKLVVLGISAAAMAASYLIVKKILDRRQAKIDAAS